MVENVKIIASKQDKLRQNKEIDKRLDIEYKYVHISVCNFLCMCMYVLCMNVCMCVYVCFYVCMYVCMY